MAMVQMSAIPRFHAARKGAGAAVLTHDGCTMSWGELEARANQRARLFASVGARVGDFETDVGPRAKITRMTHCGSRGIQHVTALV
jgi:hypothetical protein